MAEVLVSTNEEHQVHELLLHARHERELQSVPVPELERQGLLGDHPEVLLELLLAELGVQVEAGDDGSSLTLH